MNSPNNIITHTNKLPGSYRRQTYNYQLVRCESTPHTSEPLRTKHFGITKTSPEYTFEEYPDSSPCTYSFCVCAVMLLGTYFNQRDVQCHFLLL